MRIRSFAGLVGAFFLALSTQCAPAAAVGLPGPLDALQLSLTQLSTHAPGEVGIEVQELSTGLTSAVNASANMPAASTIKIPVMVEVFRQMDLGKVTLTQQVHLEAHDRDWGWGDLADAPLGGGYTVDKLMRLMITESDNTATNMLIRLVGRQPINATMERLGLRNTRLGDDIRSEGDIRSLRSSASDMTRLLSAMAHENLINSWSSREMLAILAGQQHNGLLPAPLPHGLEIAHKTGTLHDTLNDVGIVFLNDDPYVISVMTTELPSLDDGRAFIHRVSSLAYTAFAARVVQHGQGAPQLPESDATMPDDDAPQSLTPRDTISPEGVSPADVQDESPEDKMWSTTPKKAPAAGSGGRSQTTTDASDLD